MTAVAVGQELDGPPEAKLASERKLVGQDWEKIEQEFKRFLKLVLTEDRPLAMIDRRVDEFWHSFLLFTPQYRKFCREIMGFFVDHQPRTTVTSVPPSAIENFVDAYTKRFGSLDKFWLERLEPELRQLIRSGSIPQELSFDWSGWTGRRGRL